MAIKLIFDSLNSLTLFGMRAFKKLYKKKLNILFIFLVIFFDQCAQVAPPKGGPKDKTPPQEINSVPANRTTNFNSKTIIIEFDEFFRLNNLNKQLIITPSLPKEPEISINKKSLYISLNSKLKPNTTYTFNFGSAIADITENNKTQNYRYIFSTGNKLDSLKLKGKVLNAYSKEPIKNVLVLFYRTNDDSLPFHKSPYYFAKSNENGKFNIPNLKNEKLKTFALMDKNFNYIYDLPNEKIAFKDTMVQPGLNPTPEINFHLFQEKPEKQKIKYSSFKEPGKLSLGFNKPNEQIEIETLSKTNIKPLFKEKPSKDSAIYWFKNKIDTSLIIRANNKIIDTLAPFFSQGQEFHLDLNARNKFNPFDSLKLTANKPIKETPDSIMIIEDSIPETVSLLNTNQPRVFLLDKQLNEGKHYNIVIQDSTFTSLYNEKNDSTTFSFTTQKKSYYGSIKLKINKSNASTNNYVLQFINNKDNIVKQRFFQNKGVFEFQHIAPGKYKFCLIHDRNNNKKWDVGNYPEKQAEKTEWLSKEVKVRSNWELELKWN